MIQSSLPLPQEPSQERQESQQEETRAESREEQQLDNTTNNNNSDNGDSFDNADNNADNNDDNTNNNSATSSADNNDNDNDNDNDNNLSLPPPYEQVPKVPLPVIVDVNGDYELPTYQQTVANSNYNSNPNSTNVFSNNNNSHRRKDGVNGCFCCEGKTRRSKCCIIIFVLLTVLIIIATSIGVSNNRACYELELDGSNNFETLSYDPNIYYNFKIVSNYVKYGSINVLQSNSTLETNATIRVQYNSLANDRVQIEERKNTNIYELFIGQTSSINLLGVSIPPRCIVANVELILPLTLNPTTNVTSILSSSFDLAFAENANRYNQTLKILNDEVMTQFDNVSVKSLIVVTGASSINGTVKGIEDGIYIEADDIDLSLSVGIADNANSTIINIINYMGQVDLNFINGFTGKYDIFTEGTITTNYSNQITTNNQHIANNIDTSNNRFTNGTLIIKNSDGTTNVSF